MLVHPCQPVTPEASYSRLKSRVAKRSDEKLLADALAIDAQDAKDAGMVGYMARILLQATMPHSAKTGSEFSRANGNIRVSILAPADVGLPYGSYPRLLLVWLTTEAVRARDRRLCLGDSLSGFMSNLGLLPTGGRWGTISRLYDQANRLFQSHVTVCESISTDSKNQSRGSNVV
ncbi:MAG: replication protein RepA, partial [Bryocella sp.]